MHAPRCYKLWSIPARVLFSLAAGAVSTYLIVIAAVIIGPPSITSYNFSQRVYPSEHGFVHELQQSRNVLTTRTYATFATGLSRPGLRPDTIQILPFSHSPDVFVRHRALLKDAGFDTTALDGLKVEKIDDASGAKLKRLEEPHLNQLFQNSQLVYTRLNKSPLAGASFPAKNDSNMVEEFALGFPLRACWTADWSTELGGCFPITDGPTHWMSSPWKRPSPYWQNPSPGITTEYGFPTGVIPVGFAANTTIYATVWFALLAVPGFIRRCIAQHKNVCPQCRYNLQGLASNAPCPECGGEHTTH